MATTSIDELIASIRTEPYKSWPDADPLDVWRRVLSNMRKKGKDTTKCEFAIRHMIENCEASKYKKY